MIKGFCGFDCSTCPTYQAWKNNDNDLRKKLVEKYSTEENPLEIEDFNCSGCSSPEGVFFVHCAKCEIRKKRRNREGISSSLSNTD